MSSAVQALIDSFNALSEAEQQEAVIEILRRSLPSGSAELSDEALVLTAEELFLELDMREAQDARSNGTLRKQVSGIALL